MTIDEAEFEERSGRALASIARAVEASGAECDCEQKGDGVLELEFENGSRIIINRNGAAREIWVAAKSGGYHFRFDGARWVNTRDGDELFASLTRYVGEQAGRPVTLAATA